MGLAMVFQKKNAGFTLVEVMIVVAILAIIFGIAIPNYITYRKRAYNSSAVGDARNAYTASQAYFHEYPNGTISLISDLVPFGFLQTPQVTVTVGGDQPNLGITTSHNAGDRTFTLDHEGRFQ